MGGSCYFKKGELIKKFITLSLIVFEFTMGLNYLFSIIFLQEIIQKKYGRIGFSRSKNQIFEGS